MLDTLAVAEVYIDKNIELVNDISKKTNLQAVTINNLFLFFSAIHDLGKFSITFQNLVPVLLKRLQDRESSKIYQKRHDQLGFLFWGVNFPQIVGSLFSEKSANKFFDARLKELLNIFADISFGHHGVPPESESHQNTENYFIPEDREAIFEFVSLMTDLFFTVEVVEDLFNLISSEDRKIFKSAKIELKKFSWQLAGAISICDWIASGDFFEFKSDRIPILQYLEGVRPVAKEAFESTGLFCANVNERSGLDELFPEFSKTPTPLQSFCDTVEVTNPQALYILEDVTGAGKTEAASILISRILSEKIATGFFFALPSKATSNAMYDRFVNVFRKFYSSETLPSLILSHGSRFLSDTFMSSVSSKSPKDVVDYKDIVVPLNHQDSDVNMPNCNSWLADSNKKSLLADIGIGTLDQVLLASLPVRYQSLRIAGVVDKVIIVDEVHSFDHYMLKILENLIRFQASLSKPVILLSATLSKATKQKLFKAFYQGVNDSQTEKYDIKFSLQNKAFPSVSIANSQDICEQSIASLERSRKKVKIELREDKEAIKELIVEAVKKKACVCWIRNTVDDVFEAYSELSEIIPEDQITVFHSRFAQSDRIVIENKILNHFGKKSGRGQRSAKVLLATQVVEQSLDLDFDFMVTDLAPIDLIIQRVGRLHRHLRNSKGDVVQDRKLSDREAPTLYVHIPLEPENPDKDWFKNTFPIACYVYKDTANLWRTKEVLKRESTIDLPDRARFLIESVYGEDKLEIPDVFDEAEIEAEAEDRVKRDFANFNRVRFTDGYSRSSSLRWGSEEDVSTRLGEKTQKIVIAKYQHDQLCPYYQTQNERNKEKINWELSSINVREGWVSSVEVQYEDKVQQLKDKHVIDSNAIVLIENEEMQWNATKRNKEVIIEYSRDFGLQIKNKENE